MNTKKYKLPYSQLVKSLHQEWQGIFKNLAVPKIKTETTFKTLADIYSFKKRPHHNLYHIGGMLKVAKRFKTKLKHYQALQLAIWFHDVIYDPGRGDNEAKSADYAVRVLKNWKLSQFIPMVRDLIMVTKDHKLIDQKSLEQAVIIDADMETLGWPPILFKRFTKNIRKEFSNLSDKEFSSFFRKFFIYTLKQKYIFQTKAMRQKLEAKARRNLTRTLPLL